MRLIDADALKKVIEEIYFSDKWLNFRVNYGSNGVRDVILDLVTNTPAVIEERRHGEWIYRGRAVSGLYHNFCPICKHSVISNRINFCGNCGADMRGENND